MTNTTATAHTPRPWMSIRGTHAKRGAIAVETIYRTKREASAALKQYAAEMPEAKLALHPLPLEKVGDDHVLTADPISIAYRFRGCGLPEDVVMVRGFATLDAFGRWAEIEADNVYLIDSVGLTSGWLADLS